jgi:hypothetical protein
MKKYLKFVGVVLYLFFPVIIYAQSDLTDNNNYYEIYDNYIGVNNKDINRGRGYSQKFATVNRTHVFFKKATVFNGFVKYENQVYKTELKYDIVNDLVVIKYIDNDNPFSISLNPKPLHEFIIDNYRFIKLENTKFLNSFYKNGFFELVFSGNKYTFYIKHNKIGMKKTNYQTLHYLFEEKNIYFFKYKNQYYKIKTKRDIIKALPQYKEDIKTFFKYNKIDRKSLLTLFSQLDNQ